MPIEINVGGVWKTVDSIEVNVGGVWKTVDNIETNISASWKQAYSGVPEVVVAATKSILLLRFDATCYAGVTVATDGGLDSGNASNSTYTFYEQWLDAGSNSDVWVERTIISGSLWADAGSGRLVCSTARNFAVRRTSLGTSVCVIDLKFYDAASGGNLLDTQRVTLSAEYDTIP